MVETTVDRVKNLKEKRNAIILAHNYQLPKVQDIADFIGDSLGLSIKASKTEASVIIFIRTQVVLWRSGSIQRMIDYYE